MELINFLIEHFYLSIPLIVVVVLFLISNANKGGKKISPQTLISLSNNDEAFIIDLRDSDSFDSGHITNSKNIPSNDLIRRSNEINDKNKVIVLVCDMGSTSPNAGESLKERRV
jgi:rhodanese-related sulfurtransferase